VVQNCILLPVGWGLCMPYCEIWNYVLEA